MPTIRVLPDILASQVAAGEVVERPASVVKELVENSLDAGAGEIRVDLDRGGSALIRVSDDGCGMSREDALLSLERHATSKLRTAADLAAIRTLGFRGEAVPSIASVSRFRMVTREKEALAGTEILVDGGRLKDVREAGGAPGTIVEAKALFFNLPARRKFLRAETTEAAHVEHQLRLHALAAPTVRFRLRRDEREVFDLAPVAQPLDRVRQLLGPDLGRELIALPPTRDKGVAVAGFVLPPGHARKGRRHQFVFLNGRPVEDAAISRALAEGFRSSLAEGMHPAAWLWMDLDPSLVDVNVHPAKREVRFHRPQDIREAILAAVLAALRPPPAAASLPTRAGSPGFRSTPPTAAPPTVPSLAVPSRPVWSAAVQPDLPPAAPPRPAASASDPGASAAGAGNAGDLAARPEPRPAPASVPDFRILGLLHRRFVVLESTDGLVLFDPKAAKERIYYESLLPGKETALPTQGLLIPVLLELDPRDLETVLREKQALAAAGVEVDAFGGNTLQVRSLPACLPAGEPRPLLGALLDELLHDACPGSRFAYERVARTLAKRSAAGIQPKLEETQRLLAELFACDLPYCAPDGRPTLTEYGMPEIERRFGLGR